MGQSPPLRLSFGSQISRDNGFRKTQRFLRFFQPLFHSFIASLEPDTRGPENTKTRSQGPGCEYRLPFGGLSKKRVRVVGRGRFELPRFPGGFTARGDPSVFKTSPEGPKHNGLKTVCRAFSSAACALHNTTTQLDGPVLVTQLDRPVGGR